jgi:hypothetical protein
MGRRPRHLIYRADLAPHILAFRWSGPHKRSADAGRAAERRRRERTPTGWYPFYWAIFVILFTMEKRAGQVTWRLISYM